MERMEMTGMSAKRFIVPALLILAVTVCGFCQDGGSSTANDWENPEVIGRNKEPGHCTLMVYPDVETALG